MLDALKIIALALACVAPCKSICNTLESVPGRKWLDIEAAWERDGLWHLWCFEPAIPRVRLSDKSNAHRDCGPGCHAKEVGR